MAEKIVLTKKDYENIAKWAGHGVSQEKIAWRLGGFTGRALRKVFDRDPEARSAYERGIAEAHCKMSESIFDRALDNPQLAMFYAKTQMQWKEPKDDEQKEFTVNVQTYGLPDNKRSKKVED
jgi:hypothetical protein